MSRDDEDERLRAAALRNAAAILRARERADRQLAVAREETLAAAERLRLALAAAELSDWSWDAASDLFEFGPRAHAIYQFPAGKRVDWNGLLEGIHPDDRGPLNRSLERAMAEGGDYEVQYRYRRPDGEEIWVLVTGRTTYAEDGAIAGMIGVLQDVTERRRIEERLREQARDLEILNSVGAAIASRLDLAGLLETVTDASTELAGAAHGAFFRKRAGGAGYERLAFSGAPRERFADLAPSTEDDLLEVAFRGEGIVRRDLDGPRPARESAGDGATLRSWLAVPVVTPSGEAVGALVFGHPETGAFTDRIAKLVASVAAQAAVAIDNARLYESAQKAAESEQSARQEAERLSALKDDFLATLSHELRTPLGAILGWVQVLRRRPPGAADMTRALEVLERNARLQSQLIDDLLDVSRITTGKVRLDVQALEPIAIVEAAIETMRPAAEAKGIRLERILDPSAGPLYGDPQRLQQVVWNLLSNAIKFTARGGKVQVVLARVNSHVEITVADTGVGLDPAVLPHVFERFRQADPGASRRYGGLGLGLSIVKHLVELHGGTVQARSDGVERGSSFSVHLPLAVIVRPPGAELREHPRTSAGLVLRDYAVADLSGLRVLVVDDEQDARDVVHRILADCGAEPVTACSGPEALAQLASAPFDVVVSDVGMPEMDGYELLRRARELPDGRGRAPAVALTAFARPEDRIRALGAGYRVHVAKPVEACELVVAVASVVGRPVDASAGGSAATRS